MKFFKILFFNSLILGTLISISSYSWLGMWMGLEINLLSIIPLMTNKNLYSAEAAIKYFITQALASALIMFSIILMFLSESFFFLNHILFLIMNSSFLMKMGAAPFHFWFPEVMEGLSWNNSLIMLTWQKIAPMILLSYNMQMNYFIIIIILLSMMISAMMGINQISLRKIMAFSSINHIGWMLSILSLSFSFWLIYFSIYTLISINLISIFYYFNIFYFNQVNLMYTNNLLLKLFFMCNLLSLGGLPPFLGFFPKWLVINSLINNNFLILSLMMIILTLFTLFYYIRLMYSTLTLGKEIFLNYKFNLTMFWIYNLNLISLFILPMIILSTTF